MRIRVLLFGQLKDIVGGGEDSLELESGSNLAALIRHYESRFPRFRALAGSIAYSVNQEYSNRSTVLHDDDEVGLLPPVSGGKSAPEEQMAVLNSRHCSIVRDPIKIDDLKKRLADPADGALAIFEGIVRNNSRGRSTRFLDYEAYEAMAINEMERLAQAALERYQVRDVCLAHRLGRLEVGETSVVIAVASAHRGPAFEACRWLIDTLKKTVPIWKKEHFEDGAIWADGEPFPEEISGQK